MPVVMKRKLLEVGKDIGPDASYESFLEKPCSACEDIMELDHNPDIYFAFEILCKSLIVFFTHEDFEDGVFVHLFIFPNLRFKY